MFLCSCQASQPSFVRVENGRFVSDDYPSHFVGTNFWYGAILASEGQGGDIERLEAELDTLKALGMTNLRVLVSNCIDIMIIACDTSKAPECLSIAEKAKLKGVMNFTEAELSSNTVTVRSLHIDDALMMLCSEL